MNWTTYCWTGSGGWACHIWRHRWRAIVQPSGRNCWYCRSIFVCTIPRTIRLLCRISCAGWMNNNEEETDKYEKDSKKVDQMLHVACWTSVTKKWLFFEMIWGKERDDEEEIQRSQYWINFYFFDRATSQTNHRWNSNRNGFFSRNFHCTNKTITRRRCFLFLSLTSFPPKTNERQRGTRSSIIYEYEIDFISMIERKKMTSCMRCFSNQMMVHPISLPDWLWLLLPMMVHFSWLIEQDFLPHNQHFSDRNIHKLALTFPRFPLGMLEFDWLRTEILKTIDKFSSSTIISKKTKCSYLNEQNSKAHIS